MTIASLYFRYAAILAATVLLIAGCGRQETAAPPPESQGPAAVAPEAPAEMPRAPARAPATEASIVLTEADEGRALSLERNEVVEVRLQADRANGFAWIPRHNPAPVLRTAGMPEYLVDEAAGPDAPGTEVWRFSGAEAGHVHLVFDYLQPFRGDAPATQSLTFHFDVE